MNNVILSQVKVISDELKKMQDTLLNNNRAPFAVSINIALNNLHERIYYLFQNYESLVGDNDKRLMSILKKSIRVIDHITSNRGLNQIHLVRLNEIRDRLDSFITFMKITS